MDMKYRVLCVMRMCIVFVVLTLVFVMTMELFCDMSNLVGVL